MFEISEILLFIAAIAKAFMDATAHKKLISWGSFFDTEVSWKFKYKNNDPTLGDKFFGSTTYFVALTDGFHFFQSIFLTSIFLVISINFNYCIDLLVMLSKVGMDVMQIVYWLKKHTYINILINFVVIRMYFGIVFEYFYQWLSEE